MFQGDLFLQSFQGLVFKFNNATAFGANHVVMVLSQVTVLISDLAIVESNTVGKSVMTDQLQSFLDKCFLEILSVFPDQGLQFSCGDMVFGVQKHFDHC